MINKESGVVDNTVQELNNLQWGYRTARAPFAEANASARHTSYMADYFGKVAARIRDVDARRREVAKAREQGALVGTGVGATAGYLLTRGTKYKPLAGAIGAVPGFIAGAGIAGTAAKAYQELKRPPKGAHNLHKTAKVTVGPDLAVTKNHALLPKTQTRAQGALKAALIKTDPVQSLAKKIITGKVL